MRTLCHHHGAGSDAAVVRLSGAAEFSAALQHRPDPAGADRAPRPGQAAIRPGALGAAAVLGEGPQEVRAAACGARRIREREAGLSQRHEAAALPGAGRWILRMDRAWRAQAAVLHPPEVRRADRLRGPVGDLGRAEREEVDSVAIITTPANRMLGVIAERMPAILPPGAFDPWLDCAAVDAQTAAAFIVPAPETLLEAYAVSTAVNRTANDGPELIAPVHRAGERLAPGLLEGGKCTPAQDRQAPAVVVRRFVGPVGWVKSPERDQ